MRAFKKLMAGAIATAIAATMATSAFAAGFDAETGKVTVDYTAAEGQTTVLIVPADVWVEGAITDLEDADILYIDQYETADVANTAIAAGFGVKVDAETGKLAEGDYYALFGGKTGEAGAFAITPVKFNVSSTPEGPVYKFADVNADDAVDANDVTRLLRHTTGAELLTYLEAEMNARCDVNKDNEVDANDVTRLLRHTTGAELLEGIE